MNDILNFAIDSVTKSRTAFCKFISANDAGKTGGHQEGFYIPKNSIQLMFDTPGVKGENKEKLITIKWQNNFETSSRFIYYGKGTRNEYRLTRFGRGFPFLTDENVGDLLVLCQIDDYFYEGYILQTDDDIESFFSAFNINSGLTNKLIEKTESINYEDELMKCFQKYIATLQVKFPLTIDLAGNSRNCYNKVFHINSSDILKNPDKCLLHWLDSEYKLFKCIEQSRYSELLVSPFQSVEQLIECANSILNRRKSRAGKSLEHHLSEIFNCFQLKYETQVITEEQKRPDFIFPGSKQYKDLKFNQDNLIFLASKTTCKDRWRQILNEADRIKFKHLFTLQQGISTNQLAEMDKSNVVLVVPKEYKHSFPVAYHNRIQTLESFIEVVKSKQTD